MSTLQSPSALLFPRDDGAASRPASMAFAMPKLSPTPLFDQPHHPVMLMARPAEASLADLLEKVERHQQELQDMLVAHGAILLRGYALRNAEDFEAAVSGLGGRNYVYVGGNSPRTRVLHDVYTATDYPATEVISLHNELSYMPSWPKRLFFFSELPALTGGQTSLAHGGDVIRALPPEIVSELRAKKLSYVRCFYPRSRMGKSWQGTFHTEDPDELLELLRAHGSVGYWGPNGVLRVTTICEAFTVHPVTGEALWFNQAEQWHPSSLHPQLRQLLQAQGQLVHQCDFGDGSAIEDGMLTEIRRVVNNQKLLFDWHQGDLLMVDNLTMMHGRESFTGLRKTYAYLSST